MRPTHAAASRRRRNGSPSRLMTSSRFSAARAAWTVDGPPRRWRFRMSADNSSCPSSRTTARSTARCGQREPLPDRFEHRLLFDQQALQRVMEIVERRRACGWPRVPRPRSRGRDAERRTAGCQPVPRAASPRPGSGRNCGPRESRLDERREFVGGNFSRRITGPAL